MNCMNCGTSRDSDLQGLGRNLFGCWKWQNVHLGETQTLDLQGGRWLEENGSDHAQVQRASTQLERGKERERERERGERGEGSRERGTTPLQHLGTCAAPFVQPLFAKT